MLIHECVCGHYLSSHKVNGWLSSLNWECQQINGIFVIVLQLVGLQALWFLWHCLWDGDAGGGGSELVDVPESIATLLTVAMKCYSVVWPKIHQSWNAKSATQTLVFLSTTFLPRWQMFPCLNDDIDDRQWEKPEFMVRFVIHFRIWPSAQDLISLWFFHKLKHAKNDFLH